MAIQMARVAVGLVLGAVQLGAASYHIARNGDDTRTALEATSATTPWASAKPLVALTLHAGDSVLLHRGDTLRDSLILKGSGTPQNPIVVTGYGAGSQLPWIFGSQSVLAWSQVSNGLWKAVVRGGPVIRLLEAAVPVAVMRVPDTGWLVASAVEGDSALSCASCAGHDWVGASILMRTSNWTLEVHKVVRQSLGRLVFDKRAIYAPPDSVRFFLVNHLSADGSRRAWSYREADSTLWLRSNLDPNGTAFEAATRGVGIDLARASGVVVKGLGIFATSDVGIRVGGSNNRVENVEILHPDQIGISVSGAGHVLRAVSVRGAGNAAIQGGGKHLLVEALRSRRIAQLEWLGPKGMGKGCCGGRAVELNGDSMVIRRNDIDSSGYIGIGFRGQYTLVEENLVAHSCQTTDDCGGIYTYLGNYDSAGSRGSVIRHNIVRHALGAHSGWPHNWEASQGIYLDDGSHDITVDSNLAYGNSIGLFLHNNRRIRARGNLLYDNRASQLSLSHDGLAGVGDMYDNRIESNQLVGRQGQSAAPQVGIHVPQTVAMASYSQNLICQDLAIEAGCEFDAAPLWRRWRLDSTRVGIGPETLRNGRFDSAVLGWSGWPSQVHLARDSGAPCAGGRCLRVSYRDDTVVRGPLVNSGREFAVVQNQAWWLRFRARAQRPQQNLSAVFRRAWGDYASLGLSTSIVLDTVWKSFEFLVRATATESRTRVDFHNSMADSVWWLDDASLRQIPDSLLPVGDMSTLLVNDDSLFRRVDPGPRSWFDPWSQAAGGFSLPPFAGAVRFWATEAAAIGGRPLANPLRVFGAGEHWTATGVLGVLTVRTISGRWLATVVPTADGIARWSLARHGVVVVSDRMRSQAVVR